MSDSTDHAPPPPPPPPAPPEPAKSGPVRQQIKVRISDAIRLCCFADATLSLKPNDWCILHCDRYEDFGRVTHVGPLPANLDLGVTPEVKRKATLVDQGKANENQARSKSLHRVGAENIEKHGLPMRLVTTHLTFDRNLVIFVFTAPGRVDFRQLLKDLNTSLKMRVELRQIGPRDQAAAMGGIGSCGRELCCSCFLGNFVSINVKMAKAQGLSLNPTNIIGACGRLRCCLEYEYAGYRALVAALPRQGGRVRHGDDQGKVLEVYPLTQTVKIALDDGERILVVPVSELEAEGAAKGTP